MLVHAAAILLLAVVLSLALLLGAAIESEQTQDE